MDDVARWLRVVGCLMTLLLGPDMVRTASAYESPLGEPRKGLQAAIVTSRKVYKVSESVDITVTITNVSNHPIQIDPWAGNWFVQVFDEQWNLQPVIRAVDVLRPLPEPLTLEPGEPWETPLEGLRLVTGLPGSTPLWEYEPLKPGKYRLGAEYGAMEYPDHPSLWSGGLNCVLVEIEIVPRSKPPL